MTAPDRIWLCRQQFMGCVHEVDFHEDTDGTPYIRADLHAALQAENERLREVIKRRTIQDIERLVDWLNEDENNAELLLCSLTPEQVEIARAALK